MSTYGDGSNGAFNLTSGSYSLGLDTKYQFTTVNIGAGTTLTTGTTTGAVMYITATESITIDGTIDLSNKVTYGYTGSVTIDGDLYVGPGAAQGGNGSFFIGQTQALQSNGFGGGGGGGSYELSDGGSGGFGSATAGTGGIEVSTTAYLNQELFAAGTSATGSAGGSGAAYAYWQRTGGDTSGYTYSGASGRGGDAYGSNGGTAGTGFAVLTSGSGAYGWSWSALGGGGAGGRAGRPGVHIVLKAPSIIINGTIKLSGTAGTNGGNGGAGRDYNGLQADYGCGGGGGGGGNSGSAYITYSDVYTGTGSFSTSGGAAGLGGRGGTNNNTYATNGTGGSSGSLIVSARTIQLTRNANADSTFTLAKEYAMISLTTTANTQRIFSTLSKFQPLTQKDYEVRVSTHDGVYLSTITNITSEFAYQQGINQNASAMTISIARAPDNKATMLAPLQDHLSVNITDTNGDIIYVPTETPNSVGPGTDIDLNHNVDVYAFYGGYEQLLDTFGDPILDTNGDPILTDYGHPNGLRVYSGYIADYELQYGENTGVNFVVVPHATELSQYIFKDPNETVAYLNTDPVVMARDAMDSYILQGGVITYDTASMPLSGESSDYTFKLQTAREAIDKSVELLPSGYYHYVHPGENVQYLLPKGVTADHTFYYQYHISNLNLKKSLTQLKNKVYFTGGEIATDTALFKYYEDAASQTTYRAGLERLADSRVLLEDSAEALSMKEINTYKEPRYRTTVTISDKMYDIETIRLGQMVAFKNFGTFVDNLILQIVNISRAKHTVTFDLDMIVPNDTKRLIELKKQLNSQEIAKIPVAPTA